ncbi:hypothetical protein K3495_g16701, partial [Podosphaera aphanis]
HRFAREAREEVKINKAATHRSANLAQEYNGSAYLCSPAKDVKFANSCIAIETALISTKPNTFWKIDSGAFQHFSGNRNNFLNLKKWDQKQLVSTANGSVVESTGYGDCKVGDLLLKNVWLVPKFDVALISIRQLGTIGIDVLFTKNKAVATKIDTIVFVAYLTDGLYQVSSQFQHTTESAHIAQTPLNTHNNFRPQITLQTLLSIKQIPLEIQPEFESKAQLWHYRLGHIGYNAINRLGNCGLVQLDKR